MEKISVKEYNKISNGGWSEVISMEDAKKQHAKNVIAWKKAIKEYEDKDRPLRILAIHGSGRKNIYGDQKEHPEQNSVSAKLLETSLEVAKEVDSQIEIEQVVLTDFNINPCWNCVAVTSGLCGAPCTCHPVDDMQQLYPKLLRSDIHLISSGVNQSNMSSRLKLMVDRMISIDGGFFVDEDEFVEKDQEFVTKMKLLAEQGKIAYDQRLYGRVGGYFISSKDDENHHRTINHLTEDDGLDKYHYLRMVAYSLKDCMESYGYFHDHTYWAGAAANPDIDYMYDQQTLEKNIEAHERGKTVVRNAIKLAEHLKNGGLPDFEPDRINRT